MTSTCSFVLAGVKFVSGDVRLLDAPPCIELTFVGTVTVDDVRLGFTEGSRLAHEHDVWHVLTDLSDVTSDPSVLALYDIATELAESGVAPRYREALVSPSGTHELQSAQLY